MIELVWTVFEGSGLDRARERAYPTSTTIAVHILLEALDAFVEVVVVVGADVDEDAAAEYFA